MKMPKVDGCDAQQCAYNQDHQCHALAITVGDQSEPKCDTYASVNKGQKGGDPASIGQVGACKIADCVHNEQLECTAGGIKVSQQSGHVDCRTYEHR